MSKFLKGYLMLKILNNDKFTTAQNRHFLVSLKIPILNTLPFRAFLFALCSFIMCACFAAYDLAQNPENLYVFDQLAYRLWHRYMGRCANIRRRSEAKHCSSLCSQSEGDEYCGGQTRAENPTKSCSRALVMFATCSWPSLCEQSELQCWRRNRRLCGPAQISAARALLPLKGAHIPG